MKRLFAFLFVCSYSVYGQVSIQLQDMLNVFASQAGFHYFTPVVFGDIDIGSTGGPNIYDFSGVSLPGPVVSNTYDVSAIPVLAARYPAGSFTFGESEASIEKNPVFLVEGQTLYLVGEATTLAPTLMFRHLVPRNPMLTFPTVYGGTSQVATSHYDSSYNESGQLLSGSHSVSTETFAIDGYGTLRVMGYEYQCIRMRTEHDFGQADDLKEFFYFTREGVVVIVVGLLRSGPNSGTVQGGIQVLLAASVAGVNPSGERPETFVLHQNYPNPFNPATTISFDVPRQGRVQLDVWNILGQRVASLVDQVKGPGRYAVKFDAGDLASGMYFYRLEANGFTSVRKFMLMR